MKDTPQTILTSLKRFLSGTLLSRFSGLLREIVMTFAFGVTPTIASFWMAFRFANLFRRLFGEGGLNMAFIPHYENLKKKDPKEAVSFFYNLTESLTWTLLLLVFVTEAILGSFLVFQDLQADTKEVLHLTMILLPALLFLSLFALNSALLNSEKSYFLPSAAPTIVNILWIITALVLHIFSPQRAIEYLAISIVFAFAAQWLVTAIPTYSFIFKFQKNKEKKKELFTFLRPFLLTIVGVTGQQINSAVDSLFAKAADPEGPAILWYALRLQQLPFALIGVGLMNALLPPLSRSEEDGQYIHLLNFSLKKVATFMIPLTFAIFACGFAGVNLLYGRGAFTEKATYETTICLMAYGASLLPMAWTLLLASAFYAKKEYKIPTLCSLLSIGCNIGLNAFFVYALEMKSVSIAIATTIASLFNVFLLSWFLSRHKKGFAQGLGTNVLKNTVVGGCAALVTMMISSLFLKDNSWRVFLNLELFPFPRNLVSQMISLSCVGTLFLTVFLSLAYLFKIEEIIKLIPKKRKANP